MFTLSVKILIYQSRAPCARYIFRLLENAIPHVQAGAAADLELPGPQQQSQDSAGGLHRHHGRAQCGA